MNNIKTQADIIIKNGLILTINSQDTIIDKGSVVIIGEKIAAIGTNEQIENQYTSSKIIDAKGKIVMPGFVNTHTHIAMTIFRGLVDDVVLTDWLYKYVFPAEQKFINPQTVKIGNELAMLEMIHSGTTCFNNMYYFEDVTGEVAQNIGIRAVISEGLIDFPVANSPTPADGMKYTEMLLEKYKDNPLVSVAIGVHSPYTCSAELLKNAKTLARKYNALYHIHLAETKGEYENSLKDHNLTPTQYLENLGVLDNLTIAAHSVWLSDEDKKILTEKQVGIAHNPECNLKISSGIAPIADLLKLNAKVGLGTDGVASNNNLSMIQELHTMALIHKVSTMDPTALPAIKAVRIATIDGARVLNKDKEIGSLEVGKKADIIMIDNTQPHTNPLYNPFSIIAYSLYGNEVTDVIINGKLIMSESKILTIDEQKVIERANELSEKIAKEMLR